MKKIVAGSPETRSTDIVADNLARLKTLFPEAFTGGKVNFDVLRQLLGDAVDAREEKYGLTWYGKRRARQIALTPSTGTLRPCPEDSVDWDTTQNLMIEGDNLEVLKLMQKSYAGKIKLIYIDPPYNTGKDFVYTDDYRDNIKNYLTLTGQIVRDDRGGGLSSNRETSGRFHTNWLNMMYPRLKLARNLLCDSGLIAISIDDNEVDNLRKILSDIFGSDNFITTIIWQKKFSPSNDAKWLSSNHDYIILVAQSKRKWKPNLLNRSSVANARYKNPDADARGPWMSGGLDVKTYNAKYDYEIKTPSGRIVKPPAGTCWRISKERFQELIKDNRIWFGKSGNNVPRIKRFLGEVKDGITPMTIWTHEEVGHNQEATQEIKKLGVLGFDSPKPVRLLKRLVHIATNKNDIILDFFAGSGTIGHSVMLQNLMHGGHRRFIIVQLPEQIDATIPNQRNAAEFCDEIGQPHNIAELTKERLRRAGTKIKDENPEYTGDLGFRVFKLDTSNIRAWDPRPDDLEGTLLASVDHIEPGRSEQDILYELLLKLGLDLCVPIEARKIAGKTVQSVSAGTLITCLDETIARDDVEPLAIGIADWQETLDPAGETTVVFRDSAFVDDVAKTNLAAILEQRGLSNVRSL